MAEPEFHLGEPALVCRWRLAGRHVPLLNRHMRALSQRRVEGEPLSTNLLGWVKQHIEWSLAEDPAAVADGVLMIVVDKNGQAAMSTGAYQALEDTSLEGLAQRATLAQTEGLELGVAPEVFCTAADGGIVLGLKESDSAAGSVSLVKQLAETRGLNVAYDPALSYRALSGILDGKAFLVSDEHGVVAAADEDYAEADEKAATDAATAGVCTANKGDETVAFLSASLEKLFDSVR